MVNLIMLVILFLNEHVCNIACLFARVYNGQLHTRSASSEFFVIHFTAGIIHNGDCGCICFYRRSCTCMSV